MPERQSIPVDPGALAWLVRAEAERATAQHRHATALGLNLAAEMIRTLAAEREAARAAPDPAQTPPAAPAAPVVRLAVARQARIDWLAGRIGDMRAAMRRAFP